jgi:copper resistance protein C
VVSVGLTPSSATGRYSVAYRVVSDDGHPVEGSFAYELAGPAATAGTTTKPPPTAAAAPPPSVTAAVSRNQEPGGHSFVALAGVAVVLAGAAALLWERLHRRGSGGEAEP